MATVECNEDTCKHNDNGKCQLARITLQAVDEYLECCDYEQVDD